MKIAIGQINPTIGALRDNARLVADLALQAREAGARLAVFPELCLTGYPPRDLLTVSSFVPEADDALNWLTANVPAGIALAVGTVRRTSGTLLRNSALVLERGKILAEVPKALLPTYDVFDERRYFEPAAADCPRVVQLDDTRLGLTVCEDLWNDRLLWGDSRRYNRDPVAEAVEQGAELIINLSASPFALGKAALRAQLVRHAATRWNRTVVYAAALGGNDGLIFDGGSLAARSDGQFLEVAPRFEPALRVFDTHGAPVPLADIDPMEELSGALTLGLADYVRKAGIPGVIIGLSGGIDSALVAALASLALGPDKVLGVAMPSRFSSDHSVEDARALASSLGIHFQIIPIEPAHAAYESMLTQPLDALGQAHPGDVTFENVQARIRGAILMSLSNRTGRLVLTTGNKSECAVGYSTLYGDTCGGLAPIADLLKLQVYRLSRWLNDHRIAGAIPESTLTKPPSAELRPDQRDDQSLPPYDVLDPILEQLVENELSPDAAAAAVHADPELVRKVARMLYRSEYKRKQYAPTLRVTSRSWSGRDYPIAQRWI